MQYGQAERWVLVRAEGQVAADPRRTACPRLVVLAFLVGSTNGLGPFNTGSSTVPFPPGLVGLLVVVAAGHLVLLRRCPRGLFDLLLGLNRWAFRTVAYVALMTDVYPPIRLDLEEPTPRASAPTAARATSHEAPLVSSPT